MVGVREVVRSTSEEQGEREMKRSLALLGAMLVSSAQSASAMHPSFPPGKALFLRIGVTECKGPIATEDRPIYGEARLKKMRKEGKLPNTFVCGRYRYNLGGDPGAAWYHKEAIK
jgi:hypothetical protein